MAVSGKKHGKGKDRPVIGAPLWHGDKEAVWSVGVPGLDPRPSHASDFEKDHSDRDFFL